MPMDPTTSEKKPLHNRSKNNTNTNPQNSNRHVNVKTISTNMSELYWDIPETNNTSAPDQLPLQDSSSKNSLSKASYSKRKKPKLNKGYSTCDGESPTNSLPSRRRSSSLMNTLRRITQVASFPATLRRTMTQDTELSVTDLSNAITPDSTRSDLVCLMEDSPTYILKCAAAGKASDVARILSKDPTRLHARNNQGHMPIHIAAQKGHVSVLRTLLDFKVDIDAVGGHGNTALHIACLANNPEACGFLMSNGAKDSILNDDHMAPIHVVADSGNVEVAKELVKYDITVDIKGEQGNAALHYGAAKDNGHVMKTLMEAGCKPCVKNNHGFYPIHIAAQCAAASAMETIIENAIEAGYTREAILSFKDKEHNLPLHAAVNGGNIKAVMVCLKSGASVKVQQDDGSTPIHFASSQGNMDMIQMMATMQKENFTEAVFITDRTKMTPLHRSAFFDHTAVMTYLLDHGADIESKDNKDRTPLLLAASKGCWAAVQLLISKGANMTVRDKNNRNFLHLAIRFGGKMEQMGCADFMKDIKILQNCKDNFGCTPVHYASKEGHLLALDDLIRMGALLNLKNNAKQSPLHFAARYGRLNTCKRLLNSIHGPNIINETDGSGLTALHIAAENGHTKVIQLLLARGAVVNKDHNSNTALHHAAANGWTHCMKILLGVKTLLLDIGNDDDDTALHVAAKNGQITAVTLLLTMGADLRKNKEECTFMDYVIQFKNQEVAAATVQHERWEEVLHMFSKPYGCIVLGLIQHLPDVCMNVLDRCQTASECDQRSRNYHILYNFNYLERPEGFKDCKNVSKGEGWIPMKALSTMVEFNRVNCLSHPVCVTFLERKWAKYGGMIYTAYLLVYIAFLSCLTNFVLSHNSMRHHDSSMGWNDSTTHVYGNDEHGYHFSIFITGTLWFISAYCVCNIIKEIGQIISQGSRYFWEMQNYLEWLLYGTSLLFTVPFLLYRSYHWQWESGAVAVFLAWFNCLVFLQRFDFFGIYVVMFLEILRTLIQVVCVFSILIVAFGISFYILLSDEPSKAYSTPPLSILRTFTMMLELDYMNSFNELFVDDNDKTLHFGNLTLILLTIFVFFMPILLMNLLIGLAVGDIESVQKNARLKRLAMQVELHSNMEAKMPSFLFNWAQILQYKKYPNKCKSRLQAVMSMISGSAAAADGGDRMNYSEKYFAEEIYKQKIRMREMGSVLDKNYRLLRTIIQKMDIHTEEDAWDEGADDCNSSEDSSDETKSSLYKRVNGKSFKDKMYMKSAVVSMWPRGKKS